VSHISAFGYNANGQLGAGYAGKLVLEPVDAVPVGEHVRSVSSGGNYSLALLADGTVSAWGDNVNASLGNGTTVSSLLPVTTRISGVRRLASSGGHAVALTADGRVLTWGGNSYGAIGDGTGGKGEADKTANKPTPVEIGLDGVIDVASGGGTVAALFADGGVAMWGMNDKGQCGAPSSEPVLRPHELDLTGVVKVAIGGMATLPTHTLFLMADGTVSGCGAGRHGALTDPTGKKAVEVEALPPVLIPGLSNIVSVAAGTDCSYALDSSGALYAWGLQTHGQLGIPGVAEGAIVPKPALVMRDVSSVSVGAGTCAAISHGEVFTWGGNQHGECGLGSVSPVVHEPTQIASLGDVESVAVGDTHMLVVLRGSMTAPPVKVIRGPGSLELAWESPATTGPWRLGIRVKGAREYEHTSLLPSARRHPFPGLTSGQPYELAVQNASWGRRQLEGTPL
jgi:alpha-tubulin suppressor-like RCC1 family protein